VTFTYHGRLNTGFRILQLRKLQYIVSGANSRDNLPEYYQHSCSLLWIGHSQPHILLYPDAVAHRVPRASWIDELPIKVSHQLYHQALVTVRLTIVLGSLPYLKENFVQLHESYRFPSAHPPSVPED
jgi:hypothetical protein